MRVEIVTEKGNRYQVRYLGQHPNGAALNSLHWCRKDKVREDDATVTPREVGDIRLPYKD